MSDANPVVDASAAKQSEVNLSPSKSTCNVATIYTDFIIPVLAVGVVGRDIAGPSPPRGLMPVAVSTGYCFVFLEFFYDDQPKAAGFGA